MSDVRLLKFLPNDFWLRVDKQSNKNGCWIWTGAKLKSGYGIVGKWVNNKTVTFLAHRVVVYFRNKTSFKNHLEVMHSCDNPSCVNPKHLSQGTRSMNAQDCAKKGRLNNWNKLKTQCPNGHEYNERNTSWRSTKNSKYKRRACRECDKIRCRLRRKHNSPHLLK